MKKITFLLIFLSIYIVNAYAMMNKLRFRHSRSYDHKRKPLVKEESGIFCKSFPSEIDELIIKNIPTNSCKIDLKKTVQGINSLAQTNKFLNWYMNDDKRTLAWIKQLSQQFGVSNECVAGKLYTHAACQRFVLQKASLAQLNYGFNTAKQNLDMCYKLGLDLDFTYGSDSNTLLMITQISGVGYHDIAYWLIKNGANINMCNRFGQNVCMLAPAKGNTYRSMSVFLAHQDLQIDYQDLEGNTVLHCCIEGTLNPAYKSMYQQCEYLYKPALSAIRTLLERGANPTIKNNKGKTPFQFALHLGDWHDHNGILHSAKLECPEIIEVLQQAERDFNSQKNTIGVS